MIKSIIILTVIFLLSVTYPVNAEGIYNTKSVSTALTWSLGSTVISITGGIALLSCQSATEVSNFKRKMLPVAGFSLLIYGAYIGPSTGHFYANQWHRGLTFIGLSAGITGVLSLIALNNIDNIDEVSVHLWFTGASLVLLIDVIDIYTVPSSVRKYNFEYGGIYLQPKIDLSNNSYGFNIAFKF